MGAEVRYFQADATQEADAGLADRAGIMDDDVWQRRKDAQEFVGLATDPVKPQQPGGEP